MPHSDAALLVLAEAVADSCLRRGIELTTAESCTGGWIAKACTDLSGSSAWFGTGFVTYSDRAKTRLLGVPSELLRAHGAVSEPVVRAMAEGALRASGADLSVAVSGIAGPTGGSAEKPVGTVYLAFSARRGQAFQTRVLKALYAGDRDAIRRQTVAAALSGLAS